MTNWRADVLASLPDEKMAFRLVTFTTAHELMKEAAWNRRMHLDEFAGRAALAVAAYDLDEPWLAVTRNEPPLRDIRRHRMVPKRKYGADFGAWQITGMK